MSVDKYQLSSAIAGHSQDVKGVATINHVTFASCSRDRTVKIWQRTDSGYVLKSTFTAHQKFVNSVAYIAPSKDFENGLVVSGGSDHIVYAFDPFSCEIAYTLIGHEGNVCCLSTSLNGEIISGSWDSTAKVWRNGTCVLTLTGHNAAVWSVLALAPEFYITASADKTIKMWRGASLIKTIQAHSDAVRGLVAVPNVGFASCSNDGSLRVWTVKGDLVQEMFGHSSFVYSISILPDGRLLSSGEDRTARIWNGANVYQTMTQPCVSVWTICAMPKGDVIVGGSDGYIRIFTNVKERLASEAEILAFNQSVENSSIPSNQVGDVDKNKLPGVEALNQIGKKEGEVKMVRIGDVVEAHQWSNAESKWIKIGEVVDAIGSSRKTSYNGQEYDFVFDVDIKDGHPPLKLPYNASQNPYQAAQEFIHRNELPQSYLDQVANFILQNTSGVTLGASTAEGADPLTGGSRYVPGSGSQSVGGLAKPVSSKSKHFPMTSYAFLRTANMNALLAKLIQFNSDIKQSLEYADLFIKSEQEKQISDIIADIQKQKLTLNFEDWNTVLTMAFKWPVEKRFPALDLLRLIVLYATPPEDFVDLFFKGLLSNIPRPPHNLTKPQETNLMLSLRVLANMFGSPEGLNLIEYRIVEILEQFDDICGSTTNSNIHIAFGTLVYNYSVVISLRGHVDFAPILFSATRSAISKVTDGDALFRLVAAAGNTLEKCKFEITQKPQLLAQFDLLLKHGVGNDQHSVLIKEVRDLILNH